MMYNYIYIYIYIYMCFTHGDLFILAGERGHEGALHHGGHKHRARRGLRGDPLERHHEAAVTL